jgi:hypothetical protein
VNLRIKILNNSVILSLLLGELKKGETFANFLNIEGGDIHVVLISFLDYLWSVVLSGYSGFLHH